MYIERIYTPAHFEQVSQFVSLCSSTIQVDSRDSSQGFPLPVFTEIFPVTLVTLATSTIPLTCDPSRSITCSPFFLGSTGPMSWSSMKPSRRMPLLSDHKRYTLVGFWSVSNVKGYLVRAWRPVREPRWKFILNVTQMCL